MKKLVSLFAGLLAVLFVQAQGYISGTIRDSKTKEALPYAKVLVLKDSVMVGGAASGPNGCFLVKPLPLDTFNIKIELKGYQPYERHGIILDSLSREKLEIELVPTIYGGEPCDAACLKKARELDKRATKQLPLCEYKIVDKEITNLLDRVIEGRENTYDEKPKKCSVVPRGATCELHLFKATTLDTASRVGNYIHFLYHCDSILPYPLKEVAPRFSFDSATILLEVRSTYYKQTFSQAEGYAEYRGRIFFICLPVDEGDGHLRKTGRTKIFNQRNKPEATIWDPPTWIYTKQQGHWYRWLELPNGY